MPEPIEAAPRRPTPTGSLFTTANVVPSARLLTGVDWWNPPCPTGGLYSLCTGEEKTSTTGTTEEAPAAAIVEAVNCSAAASATGLQQVGREAVANLTVTMPTALETLFLTGGPDAAGSDVYLQSSGVEDITPSAGLLDVVPAISLITQALDDDLKGARGYIHVPRWTLPYLTFYGLVTRFNSELQLSNTDHRIVAGAGYDGTGPSGSAVPDGGAWIYGTGHPTVHLSDTLVPGMTVNAEGALVGTPNAVFNPNTNQTVVIAERAASVSFDVCAHVALQMCVPNPGPGCAS